MLDANRQRSTGGKLKTLARWWLRTEAISAGEAAELLISTVEPGIRARSRVDTSPTSSKPGKGTHQA